MKARIRTIKPEAHTDEDLWDLEVETGFPIFRAFTGLWGFADREGRFEWRPRPLKAGILPYWEGNFELVMDALASRGFIVKYEADGRLYGYIPSFTRHQAINQREAKSTLPEPPQRAHVHARASHTGDDDGGCAGSGAGEMPVGTPGEASLSDSEQIHPKTASSGDTCMHVHARGERKGTERNGRERNGTEPRESRDGAPQPAPPPVPQSLRDALKVPIRQRALALVRDPHSANWLRPNEWPEVLDLAKRFSSALGWHNPEGKLTRPTQTAVTKLVELLSAFDADELDKAIAAAPSDPWLNDGRKGLGSLSCEVVGRLLNPNRERPAGKGRTPQSNHGLTGLEGVEVV